MADTFPGELPEMFRGPQQIAKRWAAFTNDEIYQLHGEVHGDQDITGEIVDEYRRRRINAEARSDLMWRRYHEAVAALEARGVL